MSYEQRFSNPAWIAAGDWVRRQQVPCAQAFVLEQLHFLSDPDMGFACYPSAPWLARRCRLSERQVRDILLRLTAHGLIEPESRPGKATIWRLQLKTEVTRLPETKRGGARAPKAEPLQSLPGTPAETAPPEPLQRLPGTPAKSAGHPGRDCTEPLQRLPTEGIGRAVLGAMGGKGGSSPDRQHPQGGQRQERPQPQHLPHGEERRGGGRHRTSIAFPVRDGTFAITESQVAMLEREFPRVAAQPDKGVKWWIKTAAEWCSRRAGETPGILKRRNEAIAWIKNTWLTDEERKLAAPGKQLPLTGTEG